MYTDFGYMEEGKLGKAYDLKLMARLGGFLRPYSKLMVLSLIFVLIMAGLDLIIPYLTKEAIDRYIVVAAREVVLKGDGSPGERRFWDQYGSKFIPEKEKGKFLLPPEVLRSMDKKEITLFQKYGLLTENRYYLFTPQRPEQERLLKKHPSLFENKGSQWFISFDRMKELNREELLVLRGRDIEGVLHIALLVGFIFIMNFVMNFAQVYAMELAGQKMMHDLRMRVFSHVQDLPISFFDRNPVGRLVTRLTNDIQNVHEMFTSVLINLLKDVLLVVGIIFLLLHLNRQLALVSFSVIPLIFVVAVVFSRRARDVFREIRLKIAQMNSFFNENFSGIGVVQLFRRERENSRRFEQINEKYYLANMKQISIYAFFVPLVEILSSGAIGLLLWYGGGRVIQEAMTVGVLVAFLSYIRMFFQPIRDLSEKYNILQSAMASLERIFSLLDEGQKGLKPVRLETGPSSPRKGEMRGNVEFQHVSFSYNGEDRVLKDVSFSAGEGETVAVVGATGAGKTSLLHLLERFYEVENGAILIDGIDIREWDITQLRRQVGLVMQDTFLFAGDIEENIRLGDREIDGGRVREVSRVVNAEKFILRLPEGFGTMTGEGGQILSAGEKQLLAFARALSVNPKILVLDEATSHVDPETERFIQEGLTRLLKGRTAIVIAHRLSTIQHADRIVVLHKGRVREIGTHTELMAQKGIYFKLYQLQYGLS
ncbi:MAG TPA: ABC transporter ATP-binding protein [Thermodesulfobacteriota bacterium]|nr:ABC transporter ATP-binding protein [Thermodesulfobacteriota bacterium]